MPESPRAYRQRYLPISFDGVLGRNRIHLTKYRSSFHDNQFRKNALKDLTDFIRKPYTPGQVVDAVRKSVDRRRLKEEQARMLEQMEESGVVGPLQSNGAREAIAPPPPTD